MFDRALVAPALIDSFRKLDPRVQWRNPVMFVVYIGSILTTALWLQALGGAGEAPAWFILNVAIWLWFTVLFAKLRRSVGRRSKQSASSGATWFETDGVRKETGLRKGALAAQFRPRGPTPQG